MKSNVNVIIENERAKMLADECALIKRYQRANNPVYAGIIAGLCYRDWETDRKSTRLNSSHSGESRMPSSA